MSDMPHITEAEYEIAKIIWDKNPISTNDIAKKAVEKNNWNERTVHTLIKRLYEKNVIDYEKKGKMYYYFPIVQKTEYVKNECKNFINKFFNGAAGKLVMNLIDGDVLSEQDIKDIKDILNE